MAQRRMRESLLSNTLMFLICLMQAKLTLSHKCTVGADYMFCHKVKQTDHQAEKWDVYTVHHCRDICDKDGCVAFEYRASPGNEHQTCMIFDGTHESIQLLPTLDTCNDRFWRYSWKRPIEKSKGNCTIPK